MKRKTEIWAHRGASGYAPENTLEAFKKAVEMKADGVELDIQLTKDGELAVIHDERVDRVSGVRYVRDFTYEELRTLDVSRPMPSYGTVHIPTLAQVLEELRPTGLSVNIECKTGIYFYPGLEEKMVRLVTDMGMTDRIWCSSFNHESVIKVKKLCPGMKTGFLVSDVIADVADYVKRNGADALHPALYHMQDEGLPQRCRQKGIALHVWTVNGKEQIRSLAAAGVEAVITNYPDVAAEALDGFAAPVFPDSFTV